jgi:hypothetical protein
MTQHNLPINETGSRPAAMGGEATIIAMDRSGDNAIVVKFIVSGEVNGIQSREFRLDRDLAEQLKEMLTEELEGNGQLFNYSFA